MNPMKIEDMKINDFQVYFADYFGDFIIVNYEYVGLLFLNKKLEKVRSVDIFNNFVIEKTFFNLDHNRVLFFCREHNCFVLVNKLFEIKIINLGENDSDLVFSDLYYWSDKEILLSSYSGSIYSIHLQDYSFEKISEKYVQLEYPQFHYIWKGSKTLTIGFYDMITGVIFQQQGVLMNYSHSGSIKRKVTLSISDVEISYFKEGKCLVFNEHTAVIYYNDEFHGELSVHRPYMFRTVKYLGEEQILVLLTNKSDPYENLLRVYKI